MKEMRMLIVAAVLSSVIAGSAAGIVSISENGYWERGHTFLAFDELTTLINRLIYIVGMCAVMSAGLLFAFRRSMKSVWRTAALVGAVIVVGVLIETFDLDYHANLVWNEMPRAAHVALVLTCAINADIIVGKRWLRVLATRTAALIAVACAVIAVTSNVVSVLWFNSLQKRLSDSPNVLIITVDALRADHVRCLGYERDTTPTIDSLAARGALFTQAASNSNATRSTVPAIFTMLNPSVHGIMGSDGRVLSPRFMTLAETLKNEGYATHAYMPNGPLRRIFNFDQGFDIYDDRILGMGELERFDSAEPINASIRDWLDDHEDTRFFMYIHYIEPHAPYHPPPAYDRMFYDSDAAGEVRAISDADLRRLQRRGGEGAVLDVDDLNFYVAQYDAEIRYIDDQIGLLLDHLRQRGVLDDTVIFLTADHGEAFLEHGHWMHTTAPLYDEVVHVPLIACLPGVAREGLRLDAPVHTFDISATILDLLDLTPGNVIQARSFLPLIDGDGDPPWEYTFSESPQDKVLRNREWKLRVSKDQPELYYLPDDPHETKNLAHERKEEFEAMTKRLMSIVQANESLSGSSVVKTTGLDRETLDQLKALGYTQ